MRAMAAASCLIATLLLWSGLAGAASLPMPGNVQLDDSLGLGPIFVSDKGFTLYTSRFDDKAYQSNCNGDRYVKVLGRGQAVNILPNPDTRPTCEQAWLPFRPDASTSFDGRPARAGDSLGDWRVIQRKDDSLQWTYQGQPVYLSSYDRRPGELNGVGRLYEGRNSLFGRTPLYAPLTVPVGMDGRLTSSGFVLTNARGFTLYSPEGACDERCEHTWQPYTAPLAATLASNAGDWSFSERRDGTRQWAYQGKPLYTFAGDLAPGEVTGGDSPGWTVALLYPAVAMPEDITVQLSGDGEVYADRQGKTLYAFYCFDEAPDHLPCDTAGAPPAYRLGICGTPATCMATWRPVEAAAGARPVGNTWSIVEVDPTGERLFAKSADKREPGVTPLRVWAYHGRPVFTYVHDKMPGDIVGDKVSHLVDWGFWKLKK